MNAENTPGDVGIPDPCSQAATLAMFAEVLAASSLAAAAHRLVGMIASEFGFSRVSLGLYEDGQTTLLASSSLDISNPEAELAQRVVGAMDEAIEQATSLSWPSVHVTHSTHELAPICIEQAALQRQVGGSVGSVPLGFHGEAFAALCVERQTGPMLTIDELIALEHRLMLAGPALRWMYYGGQSWRKRAGRELCQIWTSLRQPQRRTTRRLLMGAGAILIFLAVVPLEYGVGGRARVEGAEQRVLSTPADGFIKTAYVRPGDRVKAGAALVDLLEEDQRLESERWRSQLAQYENAYAAALAKSDRVGAATSMARISEAQAQLALIDEQMSRGRITAPFDALVVQGDLSQSIGAAVHQGDALLTLATTDHYRVIVDIDETDIARVQPGQVGRLVLSSSPWSSQALRVERIVPLAKAVEGRNIFEVETSLVSPPEGLRPGLLGRSELVVGRMPALVAWTRHAVDRIRLAYWSWLG
jgi:hypothetical protein